MNSELPLIVRILWFICIGLPVGSVLTFFAWLCCISVVGLPMGLYLFDRLPFVMTLKEPAAERRVVVSHDGFYYISSSGPEQLPIIVRFVWFVLVGWWLLAIWLSVAFGLSASILGAPIGFWMFNRVPKILWLTEV